MQERYLFRGRRTDNGEWVQGYHLPAEDVTTIVMPVATSKSEGWADSWIVDPSTVGQCTGLRDKNGTLIFEGDILRDEVGSGEVEWLQEYCQFVCRTIKPHKYHALDSDGKLMKTVVIGSIHTTPELMEGNDGTDW